MHKTRSSHMPPVTDLHPAFNEICLTVSVCDWMASGHDLLWVLNAWGTQGKNRINRWSLWRKWLVLVFVYLKYSFLNWRWSLVVFMWLSVIILNLGKVVYFKETDNRQFEIGIQFIEKDLNADRIIKEFLQKIHETFQVMTRLSDKIITVFIK